ncbi:hypothetical protein ACOSQ2_002368 [Xanthoceras sorbifolium]
MCGAKGALVKEREDQKVHQFLIGLDSSIHGTVRSQILMQEPLPPLNTAFSKALTKERHHSIVRQGDKKAEAVGFAVQSSARGHGATPTKEGDKSRFTGTCSHCKKVGHDKDNCFQLLGFPDWWYSENRAAARGGGKYTRGGRGNGRGRGNVANAVGQSSGSTSGQQIGAPDRNGVQLSDAQWHHLLGMLKPSQLNDATPTHDGKYKATQWIIDTGCSNHMTGNISLFESLYDTINDVLTGIIFLGTHLYMEENKEGSSKANSTALVLLNTREFRGYVPTPWCNYFAFLHVPSPKLTDDYSKLSNNNNPLEFVWKTREIINAKKSSLGVYLTGRLLQILKKLRGPEAAARYIHGTLKNVSMAITNLMGPIEQMVLANHPVTDLYFKVVGSLVTTIMNYNGKVRVAIGAEKGLVDAQKLKSCIEKAFQMILKAACDTFIPYSPKIIFFVVLALL